MSFNRNAVGRYKDDEGIEQLQDNVGSSASYRIEDMMDMKMVMRHKDLKEIVEAIKENFKKAAMAGDQISELLEISRAQLDREFQAIED